MAVTSFQDLPLADRDRAWDGDAAEKRVRSWADANDEQHKKYGRANVQDLGRLDVDLPATLSRRRARSASLSRT